MCLNIEGVVEFKNVHSKDDPDEVAEMAGRKSRTLQVLLVVPYKAIEKFPKALYGQRARRGYLRCTIFPSCHGDGLSAYGGGRLVKDILR